MKLYYVANARMPTEKAHGIQIAKMCEAFIEGGVDMVLVVPQRATDQISVRDYYALRVEVPLVHLPALDWYGKGSFGYAIASLSFMFSYLMFLLREKRRGEKFMLYTVGLDTFSSVALTLLRVPIFSEIHDAKHPTFAGRLFFKKVRGIIAINKIIVEELQKNFPHSQARYLVEPNGVDLAAFPEIGKSEARARLDLPQDVPIVLYAGRFFEWKGLEILPRAAAAMPAIRFQIVGGSEEDFKKIVKEPLPANFFFGGSRPFTEMPLWYAAADALLVLGTKRDTQSYRYTSPMKLFEYLTTGRPIVASATPAIREIVSENEVLFYEPDNTQDLARVVEYVTAHKTELVLRTEAAKRLAGNSSWGARAKRILQFIEKNSRGI